jgi:hypothetical protein
MHPNPAISCAGAIQAEANAMATTTPGTTFTFHPATAHNFTANLTVGCVKLSVHIANTKFNCLTTEQKEEYLAHFTKACEAAVTWWSSKSVKDHVQLTVGWWAFITQVWVPQVDPDYSAVPDANLWGYPIVERLTLHYFPATGSRLSF